ncbi:GNAT family N-acetyltransferase, partial [Methanocalculus sp.]|uniref:GNAT family N-acetyltransferase n=1 Tax=Methanocalculus sp. TaxID=2004547 RepID=UPI00260B1D00
MDIDYRTLDPRSTKDLCQWLALYERSFNKPASENAWRWKYAESPFGNGEKHQIYIANSGNSIIGSLSLMPMQLYLQSYGEKEIIPSGLVTNVMVHPDFRNRGIFSTL